MTNFCTMLTSMYIVSSAMVVLMPNIATESQFQLCNVVHALKTNVEKSTSRLRSTTFSEMDDGPGSEIRGSIAPGKLLGDHPPGFGKQTLTENNIHNVDESSFATQSKENPDFVEQGELFSPRAPSSGCFGGGFCSTKGIIKRKSHKSRSSFNIRQKGLCFREFVS